MDFYLTALLQGLCFSAIALGIYISMKIFNIPDITTDGSYTLGGVVTAVLLTNHQPAYVILPAVILAGAAAGALTGIIHTKLKINALLSGILVMTALYSVNLTILGRSNLPLINLPSLFTIVSVVSDPNQNTFWILAIFVIVITFLIGYLLKTDFGIAMRATGNSESMIRSLGVNTDRMKITGLALANALTALSGYLVAQFQGFADISMGIGIVIVGLGSVIIAETLINWFKLTSVWLSLVLVLAGAVIFQLVLAFTLSVGVDPKLLKIVTAGFVLVIVSLPRLSLLRSS
ncbi:ABC transporter permease [Mucilaginibacter rubeus]|uniref:ABC transporter permease n=1 Tax=Mucilaginibacter rubeus TaxID=2027860 RepID=A0AAE6JD08_9SPHI|nr:MULTISPECIES: ABC transporter permease [Mucilaginibacter]QEM03296.1 ABC transporter permease [Mucilaginibacter rubeus]QEM15914.1 ABC transporter permease [Mucilaginibacter gossypii]QTE41343.1 ABC transporter permease [Mucilaginibacter rubeus]QTE47947.1 ABC transporter permease [Mucilaginibacter rubeus]QTE59340.1 ABC transporter permease [Mucilaginibacter rubeus]